VPANFPKSFFLVLEEGEREDYFQELGGEVCLAASFKSGGLERDSNPCNTGGFRLRNWTQGMRFLEFKIYDSQTMQCYKNNSDNVVGLARCVFALENL